MFRISLILAMIATSVTAQERFALVIGNDTYDTIQSFDTHVANAGQIAANLEIMGFEVTLIENANLVEMKRSIGRYGIRIQEAPDGSTGLIYFGGHGVNAFGDNFLLPTDVNVETAEDLDFVAVDVDTLAFKRDAENNVQNLIILDCCGENPLAGVPDMGGNGLFPTSVSDGNFIAYSTPANGTIPWDANAEITFVKMFLEQASVPGRSIESVIEHISDTIAAEYGDAQTLFWASSLVDPVIFVAAPVLSDEEKAWLAAQDGADTSLLVSFLGQYPDGEFANDAKRMLFEFLSAELAGIPDETDIEEEGITAIIPTIEVPVIEPPVVEEDVAEVEEPAIEEEPIEVANDPNPADLVYPEFVSYSEPLTVGSNDILGKTIEELVVGSPIHPPIENLLEVLWKDKECKECHTWTPADLCTQANTYLTETGAPSMDKLHPYGGSFKRNLQVWATGGCAE